MFDVAINNGLFFDGTGAPGASAIWVSAAANWWQSAASRWRKAPAR